MSTLVEEFYWNSLTGVNNIDADWDDYVQEWMDLGGSKIVEHAQTLPRLD